MEGKLKGSEIDQEKWEKCKALWVIHKGGTKYCTVHRIYFNDEIEGGKPCQECWDSCRKEER